MFGHIRASRPRKAKGEGMGSTKHKQKKKKRHERQIAEGTRVPREKIQKTPYIRYRRVKLSEMNVEDVRRIIELVKDIKI